MSDPHPPAPDPHVEVLILADDLTGACDAAQPFAAGAPTGVLARGLEGLNQAGGWRVLSINGRTRSLDPASARAATLEILRGLGGLPAAVTYKKIDSTLRGNVGAELRAVAEAFPDRPVLVAPALPAMGRTTVNGRVLVHSVPVHETEYASDPRHPVRDASVVSLLADGGRHDVQLIPLAQVRGGSAGAGLARARAPFVCVDAETDADLEAIARALGAGAPPYVLAGSAGLAGALARVWRWDAGRDPAPAWPVNGRRLAVIGTRNPTAARQVEWVRRQGLAGLIAVHPKNCHGNRRGVEVCTLQARARAGLAAGQDVVVYAAGGFAPEVSASRLLADVVGGIPSEALRGLILSGGGTAGAVLHRLGAWGIHLLGRATAPGCSLGILRGGRYDGVRAILKAGGFGTDELLDSILTLGNRPPWKVPDG